MELKSKGWEYGNTYAQTRQTSEWQTLVENMHLRRDRWPERCGMQAAKKWIFRTQRIRRANALVMPGDNASTCLHARGIEGRSVHVQHERIRQSQQSRAACAFPRQPIFTTKETEVPRLAGRLRPHLGTSCVCYFYRCFTITWFSVVGVVLFVLFLCCLPSPGNQQTQRLLATICYATYIVVLLSLGCLRTRCVVNLVSLFLALTWEPANSTPPGDQLFC